VLEQDLAAVEAVVQNHPDWARAVYNLKHRLERRSLFGDESLQAVQQRLEMLLANGVPDLVGVRLLLADGRVEALVRYAAQRVGITWYDFPSESFRYLLEPLRDEVEAVRSQAQQALTTLWHILAKYAMQPTFPRIELDTIRMMAHQTLPSLRALLTPALRRLKTVTDQELVAALGIGDRLFQQWMEEKPTDELLFEVYQRAAIRKAFYIERDWPDCEWVGEFRYVEGTSKKPRAVYLLETLFDLPLREMMTEKQQHDILERSWLWWYDQPKSGCEVEDGKFEVVVEATQTGYLFDNEGIAEVFGWMTKNKQNFQEWIGYQVPVAGDFTGAKTAYELYRWAHEEYGGHVPDAGFWDWMQLVNQLWGTEVPPEWYELDTEENEDEYIEDWDDDFDENWE
jgi:hypothetical protein